MQRKSHEVDSHGCDKYIVGRRANGEGEAFKRTRRNPKTGKERVSWEVQGYAADGKSFYASAKTKKDAQERVDKKVEAHNAQLQAAARKFQAPPNKYWDMTLAEFCSAMDARKEIGGESRKKYSGWIGHLTSEEFAVDDGYGQSVPVGSLLVRLVNYDQLHEFMVKTGTKHLDSNGKLVPRMAPSTRSRLRDYLMGKMRMAVNFKAREDLDNPARELPVIKVPQKEELRVTATHILAMIQAASSEQVRAWLVLAAHGLRFGEIQGLTADKITGNTVQISEQWTMVEYEPEKYRHGLGPRKSDAASYKLLLSDGEMSILMNSLESASLTSMYSVADGWVERLPVVPGPGGSVHCETTFRRYLKKLFAQCECEGLIPHNLRAEHITDCLETGESLDHVRRSVGHTRATSTEGYNRPRSGGAEFEVHRRRSERLGFT